VRIRRDLRSVGWRPTPFRVGSFNATRCVAFSSAVAGDGWIIRHTVPFDFFRLAVCSEGGVFNCGTVRRSFFFWRAATFVF